MDERKEIFFSAKIASGQALFPPVVKAKNQHQNFEKQLKQKRCAIRRLNVPNFSSCFLQNFIFFHTFESINFKPAGLLKIALIVTPLINVLLCLTQICIFKT